MSTHLDVTALSVVVGLVIPALSAAVTKEKAPTWLKAIANAALSAAAGGIVTAIGAGGDVVLGAWVLNIVGAFVTSTAAYFGFWKPSGITDAISRKTARLGFGPAAPKALLDSEYRSVVSALREDRAHSTGDWVVASPTPDAPTGDVLRDDNKQPFVVPVTLNGGLSQVGAATPMQPWLLSEADRLYGEVSALFSADEHAVLRAPDATMVDIVNLLDAFDRELDHLGVDASNDLIAAREQITVAAERLGNFVKGVW